MIPGVPPSQGDGIPGIFPTTDPSEEDSVSGANQNPEHALLRAGSEDEQQWKKELNFCWGSVQCLSCVINSVFPASELHLCLSGQTQKPPLPSPCFDCFTLNLSTEEH